MSYTVPFLQRRYSSSSIFIVIFCSEIDLRITISKKSSGKFHEKQGFSREEKGSKDREMDANDAKKRKSKNQQRKNGCSDSNDAQNDRT